MEAKKNIYWINAVKAFAIIAVFLSHVQAIYGYHIGIVHRFISPWYVNAFFFVSGYLLFRKQLSTPLVQQSKMLYVNRLNGGGYSLIINVICRIVVPSIMFASIEYFPSCIMQGRNFSAIGLAYKTIGGGTYWFTSALVVSELIVLMLLLTRIRNVWFYFIATFAIGLTGMFLQHGMYDYEIWAWHRGVIAVMFLGFGGLYWRYERVLTKYLKWSVLFVLLAVYVIILLLCENTNPNISILSLQPLGIVTTLIGCVLLIELCKRLPENAIMNYIGQNTLGFYFMSGALPIAVSMLAHKLINGTYLTVMLVNWIICLVIAFFIVKLINRFAPWLFDIRKIHKKN